jgi:hypothetical protein
MKRGRSTNGIVRSGGRRVAITRSSSGRPTDTSAAAVPGLMRAR